jgi:predicted transcriptional regulator of viral defense system
MIALKRHEWYIHAMKFEDLLKVTRDLPVFRSSFLLAGDRDPADVRRQLSRWKRAGKVVQLRRNVYAVALPWRRMEPHPFATANELQRPSYVSLESVLAHHGLIPEAVPLTTSVTTGRPGLFETPLGHYDYRHIAPAAFFGYREMRVFQEQTALVAEVEKALLDLAYLTPDGDSIGYLRSLRLEGLDQIDLARLERFVRRWDRPRITRAAEALLQLRQEQE